MALATILSKSITLNNAQIKALPTTSISLVAAQVGGYMFIPQSWAVLIDSRSGAYTNIDTGAADTAFWTLSINNNDFSGVIYNSTTTGDTFLSQLIGVSGQNFISPVPYYSSASIAWGVYGYVFDTGAMMDNALELKAYNAGLGNYTGGHASNSGLIVVTYMVVKGPGH